MSSDLRKTVLNTRERWTSTKYNKQVQIHDRNLQEALRALTSADEDLSGVISGLVPAVNGGTFDITVGRGLGLLFDAAKVAPDSKFRWLEIESSQTVTASAADGSNPRWDVIEIAPGVTTTGLIARDIFDPTLGTFTSQNVTVEETSLPVLQVRAGTPAAAPAFPAGVAGQIPLAYILVPTSAASLPTDGLVFCRPLLRPPGALDVGSDILGGLEDSNVRGGGIVIAASGLNFLMQQITARWARHRQQWGIAFGSTLALDVNMFDGALPAADQVIYFYAAEAPYPAGYTALAGREFIIGGAAGAAKFVSADETTRNCIVVGADLEPNQETMRGGLLAGGTMTLLDPPFGGAAVLQRTDFVYLGAADYEFGVTELKTQEMRGDRIVFTERVPSFDFPTTPTTESIWELGGFAAANLKGQAPTTAQDCSIIVVGSLSAAGEVTVKINDDCLFDKTFPISEETASVIDFQIPFESVNPAKANGDITITWVVESGAGLIAGVSTRTLSYRDSILSRR